MPPLASIIIVNYNGAKYLPDCLTALVRQSIPLEQFEVLLVDNASHDDSVDLVRTRFPWMRLLPQNRNLGFAEGNNVAVPFAQSPRLVLLNNDTIADPFWLEELLRVSEEHPEAAVASKLVFAHDPGLINSAGLFLLRDGRGADRGFRERDVGQFEREEPVFFGCGAAILIPKPPHGTPLFDPRYFMYYEDLDCGWRRRLVGLPCVYAPRSLVRHVHGGAGGEHSPLFWFSVERNRALTALRNADAFLAVYCALVLFAKVGQAVLRGRWSVAKAVGQAAISYLQLAPRVLAERFKMT